MEPRLGTDPYLIADDSGIDIKRYLSLFLSNWYWFAIALFVSISIAYGINRYSEKVYTASSTLLIRDEQYGGGNNALENIIPGGDIFKSQQNLKNEIGILKSFSLNYKVMKEMTDFQVVYVAVGRRGIAITKLYKSAPFVVIPDSSKSQPVLTIINIEILSEDAYKLSIEGEDPVEEMVFGDEFNLHGFNFRIEWRDKTDRKIIQGASNRYYFYFDSPEHLANIYRSKLSISPIEEEASLVTLTTTGYVSEQEVEYLNKLMELYIEQGLEFKNQTADSTILFIDKQLRIISDSLKLSEEKLENFRLANRFIDLSSEGELLQNRIGQLESEKRNFELQERYYEYLIDYISSRNGSGAIVSPSLIGINDQALSSLVNELSQYQMQKRDLSFNINSDNEAVRLIDQKIGTIKQALSENAGNSMNNIRQSLLNNGYQIDSVQKEFMKLPGTERNLINIQRKYDLNNTVYTYLLNKKAEAEIAKASTVSVNRIIDRAEKVNTRLVKPRTSRNYTMSILFGILIPVVLIFIIDFLNNKIIDKKDIERITKVPVIGFIGHNDLNNEIPVIEKPGSTLSESFRSIRTSIKYFNKESDHTVISITSTVSSEGKTFIAINLASIIAMLDKKVLLVGLDLRKPRIDKLLGLGNNHGLSTYLSGNSKLEDIISETETRNLFYASSGPVPPNPAELIESSRMKDFIRIVREDYDYIIIDTPPIAIVTDALLVSDLVDMNMVVVRQRYTSKNTLNLIQDLYDEKRLVNPAIIINDISLSGYYGYGLRYGYSTGYGYSYGFNYYGKYGYRNYGYGKESTGYYTE